MGKLKDLVNELNRPTPDGVKKQVEIQKPEPAPELSAEEIAEEKSKLTKEISSLDENLYPDVSYINTSDFREELDNMQFDDNARKRIEQQRQLLRAHLETISTLRQNPHISQEQLRDLEDMVEYIGKGMKSLDEHERERISLDD